MLRKATLLIVVLVLVAVGLFAGIHCMSTVTVTVGSGPIALVQQGAVVETVAATNSAIPLVLPAPSTEGTTLIAFFGAVTAGLTPTVVSMPSGWIQLAPGGDATNTMFAPWIYSTNPGGISAASAQVTATASGVRWYAHISEWNNMRGRASSSAQLPVVETGGSANSSAGTSLTQTTLDAVASPGDIAIAGWIQGISPSGTVTFTSPDQFTRLIDTQSENQTAHIDLEYRVGIPIGAALTTTLTSNATTTNATGVILVIRAAPPVADVSAFIESDGLITKNNTADLTLMLGGKLLLEDGSGSYLLEDGSGDYLLDTYVPQLGDPVTVTISP